MPATKTAFRSLFLILSLCVPTLPLHAEHYKVFILGGQSNMYGAGSKLDSLPKQLQQRQQDVLLFSGSEFSRLKPGSGRSFGPEVTFGRCIADALPDENFYLIKHSDGGTSLWNEWNLRDGRSYTRLKKVVELGLQALEKQGHSYEIVGILWTQGERDAWNLRTTAQYEADLQALIADMRSRWGNDLPFFFSRLSVLQTARPIEAVRQAQDLVADADPHAHLIETDAMEMQRDNLHFTGKGYIELGEAYAQAYLNTLSCDPAADATEKRVPQDPVAAKPITRKGVIDGAQIQVNSSDGSLSFATFDTKGNIAWHPDRTVDGSGLKDGEHLDQKHSGWMTERIDPSESFIQWDLGANYLLDSIHVWNLRSKKRTEVGVRSVDIHVSEFPFAGDPEGHEAAMWTRLGTGPVEFPQAPALGSPNLGFDLASLLGISLPKTGVRSVRFELNSNWKGSKNPTGLAEIRFRGTRVPTAPNAGPSDPANDSPDSTAPEIQFRSPQAGATEVNPRRFLTLVFDGAVAFGRGKVTLRKEDGAVVESVEVSAMPKGLKLIGGTLRIQPQAPLADSTRYFVEIDQGAILDEAGNAFAGLSGKQAWSFTTRIPDVTAPVIVSRIPANNTPDFFPADNLVITFDENIGFGTGAIRILRADGTVVESFDVAQPPPGLRYLGDTITIDPAEDLVLGTDHYVEIDPTAIRDNSGNFVAGIQGGEGWSFATPATAQYATITYLGTQFDIESTKDDPGVGWRNPTPAKPLDIDGDHILGTDGWRVGIKGKTFSDPPYARTFKLAPNGNGQGVIDNPDDPSGKDTYGGVLHDAKANTGETTAPLLSFTITEDLPQDTTVRLGLLFDVHGGPNKATYTLTQTFGGSAKVTTPELKWTGESMDVAYFDLKHLRAGYSFVVTSTTTSTKNYPHAFEQVVGITFDRGTSQE